jgi:DNA modification methylase
VTIYTGDCIEVMAGMPADSVDAVCTDPPYGLEFMGKGWDKFGAVVEHPDDGEGPWGRTSRVRYAAGHSFQAWCEAWGREALRVTKPGGYLLAFGGTRTHHRLVCGLEDAGWIIRDELDWIYATGFPKGRANLKPAHEPIVLARKPGPPRPLGIDAARISADEGYTQPTARDGSGNSGVDSTARSGLAQGTTTLGRWPSNVLLSDPALFDEPNPEVVGSGAVTSDGVAIGGAGNAASIYGSQLDKHAAADQGYGGGGGYSRFFRIPSNETGERGLEVGDANSTDTPALPDYPKAFLIPKSARSDREPVLRGQLEPGMVGGRSRADGRQWDIPGSTLANGKPKRENTHATVKPTDLMAHLIKLVTPTDGVILDPFLGSGSTAIAAERLGVKWIGIEQEPEYVAIAEARLNGVQRGLGLDTELRQPVRKLDPRVVADKGPSRPEGASMSSWFHDPEEAA